jgi:Putative Ig domain
MKSISVTQPHSAHLHATATAAFASSSADQPYQLQLVATGGRKPYTWSATNLPPGLSISPDGGVISGTPTTAGTCSATIVVTDPPGGTSTLKLDYSIR